jgi:TonB family protein
MKMHMAVLAALFPFLPVIHAQDAAPKTQQQIAPEMRAVEVDLDTRKKNLLAQAGDLDRTMGSLNRADSENTLAIGRSALEGVTWLDSIYFLVATYNRMQCDEDRKTAKAMLQDRLEYYAGALDLAVVGTNLHLAITRTPAVAQQGQRIRDELRAAKVKFDEIAASLKVPSSATKIPIPADVMKGLLINKVDPKYPPIQKAARITGIVIVNATISKSGDISDVRVECGPQMLQEPALNAVRQWKYRPYILQGEPVEVETQITVTFSLDGSPYSKDSCPVEN